MKPSDTLTTRQLADKLGITLTALRKRMQATPELYPRISTPTGYRFQIDDVASMPKGDLRYTRSGDDGSIAVRLKAARKARNMGLQDAAKATGIKVSSLIAYELGRRGIPAVRLSVLAQAYGVSVKHLISGKDE